jgi:hypothetical protein
MEGTEPSLPLLVVGANLLDVMLATADQKVDSFKQRLLENFIKVFTPCSQQDIFYLQQCSGSMTFWHGSKSEPLTNGSGFGSSSFRQLPSRR